MAKPIAGLAPPARLLCGPGPTNVDPAALEAMRKPMLGHLDPAFHAILDEVVEMLAEVYRARDGVVLPLQSTGTSGMEAGIANLVEPGDTVIVGVAGYFGARIAEIAARHGARVVEVAEEWGSHVPNERLLAALDQDPGARLMAVVHGETSTGVQHDLEGLGAALRGSDTLLMADCVTTLGGVPLDFDGWGVDYAYSCTQKCLGAPPGMSPLAISRRAFERDRRARAAGPVLARPAPAVRLLARPAGHLPPHRADPARVRAARDPARRAGGGRRGPLGAPRRAPGGASPRAPRRPASRCSPRTATGSRR